jgi:hypothetical protein
MELAILLSLAASVCTATSSVCQRLGARHLERCGEMRGFEALLVFRLARQPTWLPGFARMITGFAGAGTGAMPLTSRAMAAGPLAASQPGFTIGSELITHTTQPRRPEAGEATNRELTGRSR